MLSLFVPDPHHPTTMTNKRKYCTSCGQKLSSKHEGDALRDYCESCHLFFYDNPLPVASNIVVKNRNILLVKRKNEPYKGLWCLPMGFAESGESIEDAALRELREESGVVGKIITLVDVSSSKSDVYGDLLHLTFETDWIEGDLMAGDDASALNFFPLENLPDMAFSSNVKAIQKFISSKKEYWSIIDSFSRSVGLKETSQSTGDFLSDKLVMLIEKNADIITKHWLEEVNTRKSTPSYAKYDPQALFSRNNEVIRQFDDFLGGKYSDKDIRKFYRKLGKDRKKEGFALSEVLSALSLSRKCIWEFALSHGMWDKPIGIYIALELERRMMLFFDKAAYHISRGYEK